MELYLGQTLPFFCINKNQNASVRCGRVCFRNILGKRHLKTAISKPHDLGRAQRWWNAKKVYVFEMNFRNIRKHTAIWHPTCSQMCMLNLGVLFYFSHTKTLTRVSFGYRKTRKSRCLILSAFLENTVNVSIMFVRVFFVCANVNCIFKKCT